MDQKYANIIALGTSALSDAMDRLGIAGQALGIKPIDRSFRVCGPAFTVHNMPVDIHGGSVGDYIDDVPEGAVICIDNAGRLDCTVWGDILTVMGSDRPGQMGALRMGLSHGAFCVGCCWMLMLLLFVLGVMNLAWIAALTLLVAAEKLLPRGDIIARVGGALFIAWGAALALG